MAPIELKRNSCWAPVRVLSLPPTLLQSAFTIRKMIYFWDKDLRKLADSEHDIRMVDCQTRVLNYCNTRPWVVRKLSMRIIDVCVLKIYEPPSVGPEQWYYVLLGRAPSLNISGKVRGTRTNIKFKSDTSLLSIVYLPTVSCSLKTFLVTLSL